MVKQRYFEMLKKIIDQVPKPDILGSKATLQLFTDTIPEALVAAILQFDDTPQANTLACKSRSTTQIILESLQNNEIEDAVYKTNNTSRKASNQNKHSVQTRIYHHGSSITFIYKYEICIYKLLRENRIIV